MHEQTTLKKWLPSGYSLPKEKIILFLRRHPFVLLMKGLFVLLLMLIPVAVYFAAQYGFPSILQSEYFQPILVLLTSAYYLFIWVTMFNVFIDYYLDVWIVTTQRLVHIELMGLFNFSASEVNLSQVQDVSANIKGLFPTFLDFGDVLIQSAGTKNVILFQQVPNPAFVSKKINELAEAYRREHDTDQ